MEENLEIDFFKDIIENYCNNGIVILDKNFIIKYYNKKFVKIFNIKNIKLGMSILDLEINEGIKKNLEKLDKDFIINSMGKLLNINTKEYKEKFVVLINDITSYFNLSEHIFNDKIVELFEVEELSNIKNMASGVIHEINTPTTYIRGNLQLLEKYIKIILNKLKNIDASCEKKCENSKIVENEIIVLIGITENMSELINDSLNGTLRIIKIIDSMKNLIYSKAEKGENINIYKTIEDVLILQYNSWKYIATILVNEVQFTGEDYNILTRTFEEININVPFNQIEQVFLILLNNTIDIYKKDERDKKEKKIEINIKSKNNFLNITYKNYGEIIKEENLPKIFEPYFTTKKRGEGTGLGLFIAKKILNNYNGDINVKNNENKDGVTFNINIPIN